jgi:hypothetical protein
MPHWDEIVMRAACCVSSLNWRTNSTPEMSSGCISSSTTTNGSFRAPVAEASPQAGIAAGA